MSRPCKARWPGAAGAAVPEPGELEFDVSDEPAIEQPWTFRPPEPRKPKMGRPRRSRWTRGQIVAAVSAAAAKGEPTTQEKIAALPHVDMSVEHLRRIAGPWVDVLRDAELMTG